MDEETVESEAILIAFDFEFNNFRPKTFTPERQLVFGVLIYAIIDYLSANRKAYFRDAQKWFNSKEDDYIYSFCSICSLLGVRPDTFRTKLKRLKRQKAVFALDGKRIRG